MVNKEVQELVDSYDEFFENVDWSNLSFNTPLFDTYGNELPG